MRQQTPLSVVDDRSGGQRLKARMAEQKMTVRALSEATGLSERTVKNLRAGKPGNMATWRTVARALRCRIDEIAG